MSQFHFSLADIGGDVLAYELRWLGYLMAEMPWSSLVSNTDVYGCFSAYHCVRNFRHLLHSSSSFYHFLRDVLMITSHCFSPENFYFSSSEKFFVVEFERQWPLNTFDYCKGIPISTNICVCSKRRIWPFRLFLRLTLATLRAVIFSKCCSLLTLSRRKRWLLREFLYTGCPQKNLCAFHINQK